MLRFWMLEKPQFLSAIQGNELDIQGEEVNVIIPRKPVKTVIDINDALKAWIFGFFDNFSNR